MNFSFMTVSFPVDEVTYSEMVTLCDESYNVDHVRYNKIVNISSAMKFDVSGFFVLAYNDENDQLVGMASAIDLMGLNTFEWSLLVHPMYRKMGIADTLYEVVLEALAVRGSAGDLALVMEKENCFNREFVMQKGYSYSFSEATLEAHAAVSEVPADFMMRPFNEADTEQVMNTLMTAFGDTAEEALDLIGFNTTHEGLQMWTAIRAGEIVGTVTTRKEGEAQWVTAFAVHRDYERQGNGTAILNFVKNYTFSNGGKFVLLDVEIENEQALSVYEKAGFHKTDQIDYFVYSS